MKNRTVMLKFRKEKAPYSRRTQRIKALKWAINDDKKVQNETILRSLLQFTNLLPQVLNRVAINLPKKNKENGLF